MGIRVVALLARQAGLEVLTRSLLTNPHIDLVAVATHRLRPRSEDPGRAERPDYGRFVAACERHGVPLFEVDDRLPGVDLPFIEDLGVVDVVCSVNWRYILSPRALRYARLGSINLHRGALPEYGGAEPIRRMIEEGCERAVVTAHVMTEVVDEGPTLATVELPIRWDGRTEARVWAEVVKSALAPLYAPLFDLALDALVAAKRPSAEVEVTLRPAAAEDAANLWRWRNAPEVRDVSRRTHELDAEAYFEEVSAGVCDPGQEWHVVCAGANDVGFVKIVRRTEREYEISIALDGGYRGLGIGTRVITEATSAFLSRHPGATVLAFTRPDNRASSAAFRKAGYAFAYAEAPFHVYRFDG